MEFADQRPRRHLHFQCEVCGGVRKTSFTSFFLLVLVQLQCMLRSFAGVSYICLASLCVCVHAHVLVCKGMCLFVCPFAVVCVPVAGHLNNDVGVAGWDMAVPPDGLSDTGLETTWPLPGICICLNVSSSSPTVCVDGCPFVQAPFNRGGCILYGCEKKIGSNFYKNWAILHVPRAVLPSGVMIEQWSRSNIFVIIRW